MFTYLLIPWENGSKKQLCVSREFLTEFESDICVLWDNREERIITIHSFNKHLMSHCHVLDTVLGTGVTEGNKKGQTSCNLPSETGDRK